jgi:hypothetical protein
MSYFCLWMSYTYIKVDNIKWAVKSVKYKHVVNDDLLFSGAIFNFHFVLEYFCCINSQWWHQCDSLREFIQLHWLYRALSSSEKFN